MKQTVHYYLKHRKPEGLTFGYYFKSGLFAQYVTKEPYNHYSDRHWKSHVNFPVMESEELKEEFLLTVLGFLQTHDLNHKIVIFEKDIINRMNRPRWDNTQNGKIITIYYRNERECWTTMDQIDQLFKEKGYMNYTLYPEQHFRNDRLFRNNPFIGYRYASTPRRPYYITPIDHNGRIVEDIQEKYDSKKIFSYA